MLEAGSDTYRPARGGPLPLSKTAVAGRLAEQLAASRGELKRLAGRLGGMAATAPAAGHAVAGHAAAPHPAA
jgi:hypothetical protein